MSDVHHYIQGKPTEGTSGRWGDVYNPATGEKIRRVAFAERRRGRPGGAGRNRRVPRLGGDAAADPRAHPVQVSRIAEPRARCAGARDLRRARQGLLRRPGRDHPRRRSGRVRLRHPASVEGRVHRAGRPRHRQLVGAPAARRLRRHHAVQLPGDGADVDVPDGARLRQHLHLEAVGARPVGRLCASPNC